MALKCLTAYRLSQINGKTYLLTANEGDSREDWSGYDNEYENKTSPTGNVTLDSKVVWFNANMWDGLDNDKAYVFGGRSFSIYEVTANGLDLVFDSGSDFIRVELDGNTLDTKHYTVREGSIIVTLNADYVSTIPVGKHTIGIVSENGTATATFTVEAKQQTTGQTNPSKPSENNSTTGITTNPQTGDNSNWFLWGTLMSVSVVGFAGVEVYGRRKKVR